MSEEKFTAEDVESCWNYATEYLAQILNGEYSVDSAKEDLRCLIGSKYDSRSDEFNPKRP